jgi:hypothetical protein
VRWWLSLLTIAKTRKMKCLDRFFEAVAFEIGHVSYRVLILTWICAGGTIIQAVIAYLLFTGAN